MQKSKILRYFLDSVNIAAVAVMLSVLVVMTKDTLVEWQSISIALCAAYLTFKTKWVKNG